MDSNKFGLQLTHFSLHLIQTNKPTNIYTRSNQPCGSYFFCGQVFESLGCKVIYSHIDADRELYGYYAINKNKENIVGVIGFDTDFLIFPFSVYLELISMRFDKQCNTLTFNGYLHHKILVRLRCKQRHLPRIAGIMGCDVTNRLQTCSGNIDYAAKIAKEYERSMETKDNKTKRSRFGTGSAALKKRFNKSDTFYSGIVPLDIFRHPWCIMLLFQDYNEHTDACLAVRNKGGYIKGITYDLSMDDADLIKSQKECSSVITLSLRRWLYRYLLDDSIRSESDDQMIRVKELVCYASPRFCFKEDVAKKQWLKGIYVDLSADDAKNPLYELESHKFVKSVIDSDDYSSESGEHSGRLRIKIPEECMVRDVIYLLKYLKSLDDIEEKEDECKEKNDDKTAGSAPKCEEKVDDKTDEVKNENIERSPFVFGENDGVTNEETKISKPTQNEMNDDEHKECMKKIEKQTNKKRKRGKRGGKRKNVKNKKFKKPEPTKKPKQKKQRNGLKVWNGFVELVKVFWYQWGYRDVFIETDGIKSASESVKHKRSEFGSHGLKINARSMHYRSIIYSIYELIFVFLHIEFECKWFPKYYCDFLRYHRRRKNKKKRENENGEEEEKEKEKECFLNVPKLKLVNGVNNHQMRKDIDSWKDKVVNSGDEIKIDLQIPYVWQIINSRLFHWIWAYQTKAEKWIKECKEIEDLKQELKD